LELVSPIGYFHYKFEGNLRKVFAYRAEYSGRSLLSERQQRLYRFMHKLSSMAATHKMAVIITNHVQSSPDWLYSEYPNPLGGHVMAHSGTYRVYLKQSGYNITAKIVGSPCHSKTEAVFRIGDNGVEDRDDLPVRNPVQGDTSVQ
jgi:DNA repair protein RadA